MAELDKRIGWGEGVTLDADRADAVRELLENTRPSTGTKLLRKWFSLHTVFIPPVEACEQNRARINQAADWFRNLDCPPDDMDPEYEEFELTANGFLRQSVEAFESRPLGCEMQISGDNDCFDCDRCNFSRSTDMSC